MMLKALLKVRLAAFGAYFTGASRSRRRQSKVQKIGMLAVMLYALAAVGMLFYTSFSAIAGIYAHEGFGWLYFAMYAIMAFALMVFGSVFTAKAQLYEAKDNELLLSMPIAPRAILASRMASLWLLNLIFGLVVAVPAALAWAQAAALPVLGWVSIVLLLPALDFFSLAVTSLLAWGLSLLASRLRRKSLVTVIGSVVFLGAVVLLFTGAQKISLASRLRYFRITRAYSMTFCGVISVIAALLLFIMPMVGVVLLNVMIAAFLIVSGVTLLIEAICMRKINL